MSREEPIITKYQLNKHLLQMKSQPRFKSNGLITQMDMPYMMGKSLSFNFQLLVKVF